MRTATELLDSYNQIKAERMLLAAPFNSPDCEDAVASLNARTKDWFQEVRVFVANDKVLPLESEKLKDGFTEFAENSAEQNAFAECLAAYLSYVDSHASIFDCTNG